MNAFGYWCLASLVGAVIVLSLIAHEAIINARNAEDWRQHAVSMQMSVQALLEIKTREHWELGLALAKEQREHRLLLARREAKREQTKKAPQGTGMSGAGLELVDAHAPVVIAEEPATLILSSNTLTRTGGGND